MISDSRRRDSVHVGAAILHRQDHRRLLLPFDEADDSLVGHTLPLSKDGATLANRPLINWYDGVEFCKQA